MRIAFICGSLEPGLNGVGDYTRRLAGQLITTGNEVVIISIKDKDVCAVYKGEQLADGVTIQVLRSPEKNDIKEQVTILGQYIQKLDPHWISLQFVSFSFNRKGIIGLDTIALLKEIGRGRKWHVMFHELWIGIDTSSSKKEYFIGIIQKLSIKLLISQLQPDLITTQTHIYKELLKRIGVEAQLLPLFSNIPLINLVHDDNHSNDIDFVIFGGIHPSNKVKQFALEVKKYNEDNDKNIKLIILGRSGNRTDEWVQTWQGVGVKVDVLGKQSTEVISKILQSASVGISTTPIELAEKSGTIIAMLEHGLPVICLRDEWKARGVNIDHQIDGIFKYEHGNIAKYLAFKKRADKQDWSLDSISLQFLQLLDTN